MNQALDTLLDLEEDTEVRNVRHIALHHVPEPVTIRDLIPRILLQLLDPQRELVAVLIDVQHHRLDLLPLLIDLARVLHLVSPGQVRDVHEAVDPVFDAHEDPEIRDVPNQPLNPRAFRVSILENRPRVGFRLFQAEGNPLVLHVEVQHNSLDRVLHGEDLGWMPDLLDPGHLRDVNQSFDSLLELHEGPVVGQTDHAPFQSRSHGILPGRRRPRVRLRLLKSQRHPFPFLIIPQHFHVNLVSDGQEFGGVPDPSPGHIGDMEQSVHAAQIDEGPVVGDVLHDSLEDNPLFHPLERFLPKGIALLLQQDPS